MIMKCPLGDEVLISIRRIIRSIDLQSRYLVKQVGLTGPQLLILQEASRSGEVSVGKIAEAVSLGQATVTGIVERLEKKGLLERRRGEVDRRKVLVKITEQGKRLLAESPPLMQKYFIERFSRLHDWEQSMILSSLQRLVQMMDAKTIDAAPFLFTDPMDESPDAHHTPKDSAA